MAKVCIRNASDGTKVYDDDDATYCQYVDIKTELHPELCKLLSNDLFPNSEFFNDSENNEDCREKDYCATNPKIAFCFKEGESSHFNPFFANENLDSTKKYCSDTSNEKFSTEQDHSLTTSGHYLICSNFQTDINNCSEYELSNLLSSCCKFQDNASVKTENFKCSSNLTNPLEYTDEKHYNPNLLSSKRCNGETFCDDTVKDIYNFEQTVVSLIPNNILTGESQNELGCGNYQEKSLGNATKNILNSGNEAGSVLADLVNSYLENSSTSEFNCENKNEKSYDNTSSTGDVISLADLANTFLENASPKFKYESNNECHDTSETILNLGDQITALTNDFLVDVSLNVKTCEIDEEKSLDGSAKAVLKSDESLFSSANNYPENISSAEFSCKNNSEKSYDAKSSDIFGMGNNISLADLADTFLKNASPPGYNCESNNEICCHNTSNNVLHVDETSSLAAFANASVSMVNCKNVQENTLDVFPKNALNFEGEINESLADLAINLLENVSSSELSCESVLSSKATSGITSNVKVTENEIDKFLKDLNYVDSSDVLNKIKNVENEDECDYFCTYKGKSKTESFPECFETENKDGRCLPEVNLNDCIKKQDSSVYDPEINIFPEAKLSICEYLETERKNIEYSPEINLNYCIKKEDSENNHRNKACIYRKPNGVINTLSANNSIDFLQPERKMLGYKPVGPPVQSNESPVGKQESSQKNGIQKKQSLFAKALTCKTKKNNCSLEKIKNIKMELKRNYIRPFMLGVEDKLPIKSETVDRSDDCVLSFTGRFVMGNELFCQMQ